jgi:P2 family phage contractile tail tube protein
MKDIGRFWSAFVDGKGKFAEAASFEEPDFKWTREKFAGGGAAAEASVQMILEELTASLTLYTYDPDAMKVFGLAVRSPQPFQFRRELHDTKTQAVSTIAIRVQATLDIEFPDWDRKKLEGVKLPMFLTSYRRFRDGILEAHIDPEAGIINFGSGNVLDATNRAIGR